MSIPITREERKPATEATANAGAHETKVTGEPPLVILTGSSAYARQTLAKYIAAFSRDRLVIVEERAKSSGRIKNFVKRRFRRSGLFGMLDAIAMRLWQAVFLRQQAPDIVPDHIVSSVNNSEVADIVKAHNPRYVLLNICLLLSKAQIDRLGVPILNVHNGIAPRYRGSGNVFALSEDNFDMVGATLHYVDSGVDTGDRVSIARFDCIAENILFDRIDEAAFSKGAELAIAYVRDGKQSIPTDLVEQVSRFYPYPGFTHWLRARRNYHRRKSRPSPSVVERQWQSSFADRALQEELPLHARLHWGDGATIAWRDRATLDAISGSTPAGGRVLDVGCGEARLATSLTNYLYTGCDTCVEFLALAAGRPLVVSEARRLPFVTGVFNTTVAIGLFQHLADAQPVADEITRVTQQGGTVVVNTLRQFSKIELLFVAMASVLNHEQFRTVVAIWKRRYGAEASSGEAVARRYSVNEIARLFGCRPKDMKITYHRGFVGRLFAREFTVCVNVAKVPNPIRSAK